MALWLPGQQAYADTLYKANSGALSVLDTANTTLAAPAGIIQNYAEGSAFTAADIIAFNNLITAATTFRVSNTNATNLAIGGLTIGSSLNGTLLNPGAAITIQNGPGASGAAVANTITIGASGIDMSLAAQNLTISADTTNGSSLSTALSAPQIWSVNTGRTLTVSTNIANGGNALTINGGIAGAGTVVLGGTAGAISGGGALIINGMNTGAGNTVTLSGNNGAAGLGATTVGGGSTLNIDQSAASQNKLNDTAALTLNRATLNLQGTGGGTEAVNNLVLGGSGLNSITRSAGTGILGAGAITRSAGAVLNVGAASIATTSNANVNGILGGWAVINQTDFATNAFASVAATTTAENLWTSALNEVQTANVVLTAGRAVNSLKFNGAGAQTLGLGAATLNVTSGGLLRNANQTTVISNGTLTAGGTADTVADELFVWNNQNTMTISSVIANNGTDVVSLVKAGAGSLTLSGANTYGGTTTVAQGILNFGDNAVGGNVAAFGAGDIINNGTIQINKTAAASAGQRTISNNISGSGALLNLRAGTFILSGNNSYYGDTTVSLGTLQADSAGGFSSNSRMVLNVAGVGAVNNSGAAVSVSALRGDQATAFFNLNASNLTLSGVDPTSNGAAQVYQGIIQGTGGLIKNGAFTQQLTGTGALSYSGATTVNAGILQTNKAMSTSGLTVNNSATATSLGGFATFISNIANSLGTTASVNLATAGSTWQINTGFNQSVGTLTGATDSRITLANTGLTVTDAVGGTFAGVISGTGSFTKDGVGTLVLTGGNSYTGATTITNGTVQIGAANAVQVINDSSAVSIGATGVLDLNGNNETIGSLAGVAGSSILFGAGSLTTGRNNTNTDFAGTTTGGGGLNKVGTGTQTLSGANAFTGNITISNYGGQSGGGLTIGTGGSIADAANIRNAGLNTTYTANTTDTVGAVNGTRNTTLAIGTGAVLSATYVNGTAVVGSAAADTDSTAGRVIRLDGGITNPQVGMQVSGTSIPAGAYIVQVLDANHVLINAQPTPTTANTALTTSTVGVLGSAISGAGGFTKEGAGLLILTGTSTNTGATTINNGDVQVGGVWTGQKFSIHDTISDSSALVFAGTGTQNLNFANSGTNLLPFERVGSIAGGSVTTTINLTAGSSVGVLAFGGDNSSTTFGGRFLPANSAGVLIKEGTGTFIWNNPTADVYDGLLEIRGGGFTTASQGLDAAQIVRMQNSSGSLATVFTSGVTDTFGLIEGGAGVTRIQPSTSLTGALYGNYVSGVAPSMVLSAATVTTASSTTSSGFNGVISGSGALTKAGTGTWQLYGANTYTGETRIDAGTLTLGVLSRSAGVGATAGSDIRGSLDDTTSLRLTGGTLSINNLTETVAGIGASSTAGTIAIGNGALTFGAQTTQSTGTVFTSNLNGVLNLTGSAATQTLTLTGNSSSYAGSLNVGTNAAVTLGTGVNFGDSARVNLNGTGTQLTVAVTDTIGSLAGTGDAVLTAALTLREARSGTVSATAFSGNLTSGVGALILGSFGGLTISGNNANTGGITLSGGSSLNLAYGAGNNILPATGALTLNGATIRVLSTAATSSILESVASTSLNAGASVIESWTNYTADSALLQGSGNAGINLGAITRAAGGTLNVDDKGAATSMANAASGILGGYAVLGGTTWAVANGANTAISGLASGSYTNDGIGANVHNNITAGTGTGTAATLRFNNTGAVTQTAAITSGTGGILVTGNVGANTSTISGALNATGNELIIHQYNLRGDLVLSNVAGTNTVITTAGGGKTLITNSIAGTGATNIGYGYLQLGASTAGGSAAGNVGSGVILNNGTLGVNRSNAVSLAAIISGTGNIEQLGSGTTTLAAANTFAGRVTVRNGTLEITNNAGLGLASTSATNRWANLTSVNTGGSLLVNVTAGGTVTEALNLDGGTLDIRSTAAATLAGPVYLTSDSTITISNPGAAVNHLVTGEVYALPGADLTVTNVGGATPSTLVLAPAATTGSRWENTTINAGGRLQIGNNSRGFIGTGTVANSGTLRLVLNDQFYVLGNTFTGAGSGDLLITRDGQNNTGSYYLTGDLSGYAGSITAFGTTHATNAQNVVVELGNDTYNTSFGSGALNVTSASTLAAGGTASMRTHFNQDVTLSNTINLTPAADATTARNAQFFRAGLGNLTLSGTINLGATNTGIASQRNLIQTETGGKLFLNGTLAGGGANNLLNVVNNNVIVVGGSVSNTYSGILSGNNVWVFNNSGNTTLSGANTVNGANNYIRQGTVTLTGGAASNDDNDWQVLNGGTLAIAASETIGNLYSQRGGIVNVASGQTLTVDDASSQLIAGQFTGSGNLVIAGGNFMSMYSSAANTISGTLNVNQGGIASNNLTNALGSFSSFTLGSAALNGGLEYVGAGETFAKNITLAGTGSNYIAANGSGGLILSGNITATGATSTLRLIGQSGGYFNPIVNRVDGIISDGANALTISIPATANDDRFGATGRWTLTNASNDFSGGINVNIGILEFGGNLGSGGSVATSQLGDLTATRTIDLGTANFDGRRYDIFGTGDQLAATASITAQNNTLSPNSNVGTLIFNSTSASTFTLPSNITLTQSFSSTTNPGAGQIVSNGVGAVVIQGGLTSGASGNRNWILNGSNTGANAINGVIANGSGNTVSLIKQGAGTWRINNAANTFTGNVTVNDGTLEIAGGGAISDAATVALNGDGGDGFFSGTAKVRFVASETVGLLSGDILTEATIDAGQTLTITAGNSTMNGLITGSGNLVRSVSGTTAGTLTTSASNTYTGTTTIGAAGTATASAGISITQLANGGVNSGLGASSNAATNLVFTSNTANNQGGILTWTGLANQSTDRLFTLGTGTLAATIAASGTVVGTTATGSMRWTNTGSLVLAGTGTRTLTLGGTGLVENEFAPLVGDNGGATTIAKTGAGLWVLKNTANTFTGGVNVSGGTLVIENAGAVPSAGGLVVNGAAGTGLLVRGGITLTNALTNSTANGGFGAQTGTNILSGAFTNTADTRVQARSGASLEFSGAISGAGGLFKADEGLVIISGNNTHTGNTTIVGGTLQLNFATNNGLKVAAASTLTLGGASATTLLGIDDNVASQAYLAGNGPATLELVGTAATAVQTVASTAVNAGASSVIRSSGNAIVNFGTITRAAGGTLNLGAASITQATNSNTNGILGGWATINKTDWAQTATVGAAGTAVTAIAAYNVDAYATGNNTDITLASASTGAATLTNSLRFNVAQATTLTIGAPFGVVGTAVGLQSSGILITPAVGANATIITGAGLQNAATTAGLEAAIIHQHNTLGDLEIASVIQNNTVANAQGLTKSGAGRVILNALNSYTGNIQINEGIVQVGGSAAAPTTATNAFLGGVNVVGTGNNVGTIDIQKGAALNFLSTSSQVLNTGVISGGGDINLLAGNTSILQLDDASTNFVGALNATGGTVRVGAAQAGALGGAAGVATFNSGSTLQFFGATAAISRTVVLNQGAVVTAVANGATNTAASLAARVTLNNTITSGVTFNTDANQTLTLSGVVYGSNGLTKTGNGTLALSGNNFSDVYDGFTGINKTPTLLGQIQVNAGVLNVGGTRALGAFGVGNETIAASGASIDLRGNALNLSDDSAVSREIIKVQGSGFVNANGNATGGLRNTTGTGAISFLTLDGNTTINSGGAANGSVIQVATFDTNLSNANTLTNAFTRNQPVIAGGGFDLTIVGSRNSTDNTTLLDPSFSSALNSLLVREGALRITKETTAPTAFDGLKAADFTNGLEIGYGGQTAADLTGATLANTGSFLGPNVGARLYLLNLYGNHNTVNITMNGTLAATNSGVNYITVDFSNIPDGSTYLDGTLSLTGAAMRNVLQSDSTGNYSVVEQGNTTGSTYSKLVVGGVIQGAGGFTKTGAGEVRLTAANTFTGDVNVLSFGSPATPFESRTYKLNGIDYATQGTAEGWAEYSLTLNGPNGAISGVSNINLQRRGMITLDNTGRLNATSGVVGANNNDRINNAAVINLDHGWLRLNTGTTANTETLGTVNVSSGTNIVDLYGTDGSGVNTTLTINNLNRTAGGTVRFTNLDATSTFSAATSGDSAKVTVNTLGVTQIGGAGASGTTTTSLVQGVFGGNVPIDLTTDLRILGFNNGNVSDLWNQQRNLQFTAGSHFTTYDGTTLRPLDDSEYFTAPTGVINPTTLVNTNQNVNLSDLNTIVSQDSTINALRLGALTDHNGTGATGLVDHHAINVLVDGTLKINSGMISSAYWTVGNTASATTSIYGGTLDFNAKEAIVNVQNGFFRTTDGTIAGGSLQIQSAITNAVGLTKTGSQQLILDGGNTYTGLTTISEGTLFLRNGKSALGASGSGNGVVIVGSGNLNSGNGIQVGSATSREDIYIGALAGDQNILRVDNDVTNWYSNITIDNVDTAGRAFQTPRIRTDNSATSIINGNIGGGNTAVINDVSGIDSRIVQFDSAGNNVFIVRGQFGDKLDGSGNAIPITDPISTLPTLGGTRTNENEVLRVNLTGGSDETNLILDRNYNAAGRLTIARGTIVANYDPAAADGTGFWTAAAISKIPNADSTSTTYNVNGGTTFQGFILGTTGNTYGAIFLNRANQVFNMASWTMAGTGAKFIGGLNETGTVTYGDGTGNLTFAGAIANLQAADGGTVVFNQRLTGVVGTAPSSFGYVKQGRGTVELRNTTSTTASDSDFVLAGGTLSLNHTAATSVALVGTLNARFDGGTIISIASSGANTTEGFASNNANTRFLNFSVGGNEIVARTTSTGTPRNSTITLGNGNAGGTTPTSNLLRGIGATANLVEDQAAGGTAQITLDFNATTTAAVKNQVIPWATYSTLSRTATDFAMSDVGNGNDVRAYGRALDEYQNNVASWSAIASGSSGPDISENGGSGFSGTLGGNLTVSTLRFDAAADSTINLGTSVLTVGGNGLASSGGGILVSSNVGSSNKTITGSGGAALTTTGGIAELIIHQYGTGNLNINVPITGANALTITGPSTTNAATIGTTGAVVLNGTNTYTGKTYLNGAVLSIDDASRLGANPGAFAADQLTFNGGTLRYTGSGLSQTGSNYGITFNGNGGTIDVTDGAGEFRLANDIASAATYRGDLIKVGAGTLTLTGGNIGSGDTNNAGFLGLIDVREGTLRLNGTSTGAAGGTTILGSSNTFADGTILRSGANLAIQLGNGNDTGTWDIGEWITFKGNNYVAVGTVNTQTGNVATTPGFNDPNNERGVNLSGVLTIEGAVTFDTVPGQTLQLNANGSGYVTGNGTITKDGQGILTLNTNNPDFTGAINVLQGRLTAVGQAAVLGTGYTVANGSKVITLGSDSRQGLAEFTITSDSISGGTHELNHAVNVVYNPAQAKRLLFETFANGSQIEVNGDITLNDNLNLYVNDASETGGSQNYVNINSKLRDGATTSGNLIFTSDDTGNANDNTNGRTYNYLVLKNDNTTFTGDVRVSTHTSFDQDETAILRLEHATALTAANDLDLGFNSILQAGGGARTIGSLATNGGTGPFLGNNAGGTMGASTNGTSVVIENAAATAGTLTITQTTPVQTEVQWNAHFRDGTLNSVFFAPGVGPLASAALNIVKAGDGWATITTDNNYTGTTLVSGGTLQVGRGNVGDTGALSGNAGFTSNTGTTVAGTGQIHGSSTILGNLKPGDEAGSTMGTLTFTAATTLGAASVTTLQVQRSTYTAFNAVGYNDPAFGSFASSLTTDPTFSHLLNDPVTTSQHDKLIVTGGLTASTGAKITLVNNGYNPTHGDVFNLLDWTGIATTFTVGGTVDGNGNGLFRTGAETGFDLELFELGGGFRWDVSLFNTAGILVVVVPEPSRALLLLIGLLGLMMRRRRQTV